MSGNSTVKPTVKVMIMPCNCPDCLQQIDFDTVEYYARRKYVDGASTMSLLANARTDGDKAHIALAALIDLDDDTFFSLDIVCDRQCREKLAALRERLLVMFKLPLHRGIAVGQH